jgi:hypothetical protein
MMPQDLAGVPIVDMAMTISDMAVVIPPDMAVKPPDLTTPPTPGEVVLSDVVGSGFANVGTTELRADGTHLFGTITDLPATPRSSVFNSVSFVPGSITGCHMERYTTSSLPPADINIGQISMTGYVSTLKVGAPCLAGLAGNPGLPAVVPNTINCNRTTPATSYDCIYGVGPIMNNGACTVAGDPANTANGWNTHSSAGAVVGQSPVGQVNADPTILPNGATVTFSITGGSGFAAGSTPLAPASMPTLVTTTNGGTTASNLSDLGSPVGTIDPSTNLVITWSCDGAATGGSGCAGAAANDIIAVEVITSTVVRGGPFAFPIVGTNPYGIGQCFEQTSKAGGSVTIPAAALSAMISTGTDKSVAVIVSRLDSTSVSGGGNTVIFGAGRGFYGFLNTK